MDSRTIRRILANQPGFWGCFARDNLPTFEGRVARDVIRASSKASGAKYISLICNTDRLSGTGIHWVAIMISGDGQRCYLFNSLGGLPHEAPEIVAFCSQFDKCFYNEAGHQRQDEITCGAYACYCVVEMNRKQTSFRKIAHSFEKKIANDDKFVRDWLKGEFGVTLPEVNHS